MLKFLLQRLILMVPALFGVTFIVFLMLHLAPGDPVDMLIWAGGAASEEQREVLRHEFGLDKPLPRQYIDYLGKIVRGDLGYTYRGRRSVSAQIWEQLPSTLLLTTSGMSIAIVFGVGLGILGALKENSWVDSFVMGFANLGAGIPIFWLSIMLILLFAVALRWLPAGGAEGWRSLVLPSFALGWPFSGVIARLARESMINQLNQEYVAMANAKGLPERLVIIRHAWRNSLIPVATIIGLQTGNMMAGAVLVEMVFARRGIGRLIAQSTLEMDMPMVQGAVLVVAGIFMLINLLVDLSYYLIDPRIRQ